MADKTIGELKKATSLNDDSLLVAEQQGEAVAVEGVLFKNIVKDYVDDALGGIDPDVTADEVEFSDGENLQQKYNNGDLGGADGLTPHIGENGNWFIGDEDTNVQAAGQTVTTVQTVTLTAAGWTNLSQTVGCPGILANDTNQVITTFPDIANKKAYMDARIVCVDNGANSLTFTAKTVPTTDILVYVAIEEAGSGTLETYSADEIVVGTWIDGKPLYRKVFVGTTPVVSTNGTFSWGSFDTGSAIDSLLPVKGIVYNGSDSLTLPHTTNDGTGRIKTSSNRTTGRVLVGSNSSALGGLPLVLIVEYTKTTDIANADMPAAAALAVSYNEGVDEA